MKVCGFHDTTTGSLFQATALQAWPEQNNGRATIDVGNGIANDWKLCGGTGTHDRKSGVNFYLHWRIAEDYLDESNGVIIQIWANESVKLRKKTKDNGDDIARRAHQHVLMRKQA